MKVTYRWIREWVATELAPDELAERLTMAGLEVERLEPLGHGLADVRVARVRGTRKHPQADRLTLCDVEDGTGVIPVVCGAPNVREGAFVALAPVGATLPDGTQIRKAKLRGEVSEGMLLSEAELGLSSNHDGLLLIDGTPTVGRPLAEELGLDDWVLDISLTPNRSDCLGILGIAREVAALTGAALTPPPIRLLEVGPPAAQAVRVEVQDPARCSRYSARVVRGVRVAPSPAAIRWRLGAVGIRPISNVVDATNLVLIELGHPLHAFDLARVEGGRVVVRSARAGEKLLALDGVERELTTDDLVIADACVPMALAGIMGGEVSGVHTDTADLVLESAHFDPISIRRSARRHGMHTEASHRFERGTDPVGLATALDRLAARIVELAGGAIAAGVVEAMPRPYQPQRIRFRPERTRALLGTTITDEACLAALGSIGISVDSRTLEATVPPWRPDITREVDLIEEVARLAGYGEIPAAMADGAPLMGLGSTAAVSAQRIELVRDVLAGQGYREIVRLAFTSPEVIARFDFPDGRAEPVRIANPLGEDTSVLATALLPGLVETARAQLNRGADSIRLFQVARVHRRAGGRWPYREVETAAAIGGGVFGRGAFPESRRECDLFDLKGTLEILLERTGIKGVAFRPVADLQYAEPGQAGEIWCNDRKVGELVMLSRRLLDELGISAQLHAFELDLSPVGASVLPRYAGFSRQPVATRDLALDVPAALAASEVQGELRKARWAIDVELFDVYQGEGLAEGRKSLAFHVRFQHGERALTEAEVAAALDRVLGDLEANQDAKRR